MNKILLSLLLLCFCASLSAQVTPPLQPKESVAELTGGCCYKQVYHKPVYKLIIDTVTVVPSWTEYVQVKPTFKETKFTFTSDKLVKLEYKNGLWCSVVTPKEVKKINAKVFDKPPSLDKITHPAQYEYVESLRVLKNGYFEWVPKKCE